MESDAVKMAIEALEFGNGRDASVNLQGALDELRGRHKVDDGCVIERTLNRVIGQIELARAALEQGGEPVAGDPLRGALGGSFCITESKGHPEPTNRSYRMIFSFPTMEAMHAAHAAYVTGEPPLPTLHRLGQEFDAGEAEPVAYRFVHLDYAGRKVSRYGAYPERVNGHDPIEAHPLYEHPQKSRGQAFDGEGEGEEFNRGYLLAVANLMNLHGAEVEARDVLMQLGCSREAMEAMDFCDFDLEPLRRIFDDIEARALSSAKRGEG